MIISEAVDCELDFLYSVQSVGIVDVLTFIQSFNPVVPKLFLQGSSFVDYNYFKVFLERCEKTIPRSLTHLD